MANYEKKAPARRGVVVKLANARVEVRVEEGLTKNSKRFQNVSFFAPCNLDDINEGEIKYASTLWEERIDAFKKAGKNARFDVEGYLKKGKPWKTKDGATVTTNEFVITKLDPVAKRSTNSSQVEEVDDDDGSDDVPF